MSARFLLWALREVPAVVVYPSFSVGTIIVVTLVGVAAFREQVEKRKLAALGLILGALVLLNV
jgi:multidrug transporter EmrE-like cation transporter